MIRHPTGLLTGVCWLAMVAIAFATRPLIPVDETRYVTVAWEMWVNHSFAVPLLNGLPYAHKPPLFFWLIDAGWMLFGVNEWWPRLVAPLCALANLALIDRLALRLWPERPRIRDLAPLIFVGTWFVAVYLTAVMFDMLLLTCILGAWLALHIALRGGMTRGLTAFGVMLGLGLLTKGPVVFVYTLPLALSAPLWCGDSVPARWSHWYAATFVATVFGIAIAGVWLLALLRSADPNYFGQLLVNQTADRVAGALGHGRPWWWYLPFVPVLLLPWIAWPAMWRGCYRLTQRPIDTGLRFAVIGIGSGLLVLSFIGGKQVHYLLPLLALAALLLARAIEEVPSIDRRIGRLPVALLMSPILLVPLYMLLHSFGQFGALRPDSVPIWCPIALLAPMAGLVGIKPRVASEIVPRVATLSVAFAAICLAVACHMLGREFDMEPLGDYLRQQQESNHPLAIVGEYQGQFGFYARLRQPIKSLTSDDAQSWALSNPTGQIILKPGREAPAEVRVDFRDRALDGDWVVIACRNLLDSNRVGK
jgi:4-amino-4-deoxy-L-arabinose transferase-like glycosyltransferase